MSTKLKLYLGRKIIDCLHKSTKYSPSLIQPLIQIGQENGGKTELNVPLNVLERQLGCFLKTATFLDLNFKPKTIVVEYSSPNIAKPFHFGHLRSTIIGNFISNLNIFLRNKVTQLNYIGDWGTQFGFIKIGVEDLKYTPEAIQRDPIKLLYQSYVHANKLAEKDPAVLEKARSEFLKLERGSPDDLKFWKDYLSYTKMELQNTYSRLGVSFDEYNYESDYSTKDIQAIIEILRKKNIIHKEKDGKEVAVINERKVSVIKTTVQLYT
ncbi:hypothetical protein NQ318_017938 [Aromia moschata]|uniref:Probable arginine--tRNA ligase, mitochondrial n=1 Tax=Aromia moschata TaxID=1265417 RepID=A0AAV8YDF8_9CUCU|nr:hypothetical protein NQ318_017938 [Aromia moschata]